MHCEITTRTILLFIMHSIITISDTLEYFMTMISVTFKTQFSGCLSSILLISYHFVNGTCCCHWLWATLSWVIHRSPVPDWWCTILATVQQHHSDGKRPGSEDPLMYMTWSHMLSFAYYSFTSFFSQPYHLLNDVLRRVGGIGTICETSSLPLSSLT